MTTKHIYVLKERWVLLGAPIKTTKDLITLVDCSVIRQWGTTQGLGEIALRGPTSKTVLDPCGNTTVPITSILFTIECTYK